MVYKSNIIQMLSGSLKREKVENLQKTTFKYSHNRHISIDLDLRNAIICLKEVLNHVFNILIIVLLFIGGFLCLNGFLLV